MASMAMEKTFNTQTNPVRMRETNKRRPIQTVVICVFSI